MTSVSVENYLKAIFSLEQHLSENDRVKSKDIAEALSIAQPSVTSMLKSLSGHGLIDYLPYQGVRMSDKGRLAALRVIRKHRLIEVFLIEALSLGWDEVHQEAERLEHAMSDKVADRLEEFLGFPTHDPHGDPIPDRNGMMPVVNGASLTSVEPPAEVEVVRVLDQSPEFLRYLEKQGLVPGTEIRVTKMEPFDGPIEVVTSAGAVHLSRSQARRIVVWSRKEEATEVESS